MAGTCQPIDRVAGYGSVWQYCEPTTGVWTTFAGVKDTASPNTVLTALDVTSQDGYGSVNHTQTIPLDLADTDDVEVAGDFILDQYKRVRIFFEDKVITEWRLVMTQIPTQPSFTFCAWVMGMPVDLPLRDLASNAISLSVTSKPYFVELNP